MTSLKDIFFSPFMEAGLLSYQLSSHDCFQFADIFKFVSTKTSLQYGKTNGNRSEISYPDITKKHMSSLIIKL